MNAINELTPSVAAGTLRAGRAASAVVFGGRRALASLVVLGCGLLGAVPAQTNYQRLISFTVEDVYSGTAQASLIEGSDGKLYGTTGDGESSSGSLFSMNKDGSDFTVLHRGGSRGRLLEGSDGALYGIVASAICTLQKNGSGFTTLYAGVSSTGLIEGSDGALYGTSRYGGVDDMGLMFKVKKDGSDFTVLHEFSGGMDGNRPEAALLKASDGALYGTTLWGGGSGYGTVFKVNEDGSGYRVVFSSPALSMDGLTSPASSLVEGSDGALYGTMQGGGEDGVGGIFKVKKDGTGFRMLRGFSDTVGDGRYPSGELTKGTNGALYGVAGGGQHDVGMVYKLNEEGSGFEVVHSFGGIDGDGSGPAAALLKASDGALYGTTQQGGDSGLGTVYRIFSSPVRITITGLELVTEGARLSLSGGAVGQTYQVQATVDLRKTNAWQIIGSKTADIDGRFQFLDPDAASYPTRFYRVVTP